MQVDQSIIQSFIQSVTKVSVDTAEAAHKYLGSHKNLYVTGDYPIADPIFPLNDPKYQDYLKQIPLHNHGITKYKNKDFPQDLINYKGVFLSFINKDTIDSSEFESFHEIIELFKDHPEFAEVFNAKDDSELIKKIKNIIHNIVERYLFMTKPTECCPDNINDIIIEYVKEKLCRYFLNELKIQILVPICLASFEIDSISLEDGVTIKRIPEEIQKSRQSACRYESIANEWIAASATHMLVLDNYYFPNSRDIPIGLSTHNINAYPIDIIDLVFSAIRAVTGYSIGYMQIISKPVDWIDSFTADLVPLYGAITEMVKPIEKKQIWLQIPISDVTEAQSKMIRNIYRGITSINDNRLIFATKRLNRCMYVT